MSPAPAETFKTWLLAHRRLADNYIELTAAIAAECSY